MRPVKYVIGAARGTWGHDVMGKGCIMGKGGSR